MLQRGLALAVRLKYSILGVIETPKGFQEHTSTFEVAGRIGSTLLAKHPELFLDSKGRIIDSKEKPSNREGDKTVSDL